MQRTGDHPELNSLFLAEMMYQLNVLQEQKHEHEAAAAAPPDAQAAGESAGARRPSGEHRRQQSLGHVRSLLFGDTDPNDPAFSAMRAMGQTGVWRELARASPN
jgi:hypothetical protein